MSTWSARRATTSVDLVALVHVEKCLQHLVGHVRDGFFGERHLRVQKVRETASVQILHDDLEVTKREYTNPNLVVVVVGVVDVDNVGTLRSDLEGNLATKKEEVVVVLDLLDSEVTTILRHVVPFHDENSARLHSAEGTLSQLFPSFVIHFRVRHLHVHN